MPLKFKVVRLKNNIREVIWECILTVIFVLVFVHIIDPAHATQQSRPCVVLDNDLAKYTLQYSK